MGHCCRKQSIEKQSVQQAGDQLHPDGLEAHLQKFEEFNRPLYGPVWGLRYARLRFREADEEVKSKNSQEVTTTPCQSN